ncbi:hypothetical protein FDI63_gp085 [Mycobacterium phage ChrisnMich]|uniref:Uncharacterized protein n=1 Tax=Mycobacterium phage ChrisnMich TaxID=1034130 RepID=G1BLE2_9CAUD|nr:hypothetical protein FDI63_gp085 [Mycobacterium phage ChrisnMich]AEJ94617.1 hypothetical protein CHRISNMICH_85 [Mycobacterium phage ChrisnMich]
MVNLLPGPTRDAMTLAKRAVTALERIARAMPTQPLPVGLPQINPEIALHVATGCRLVFNQGEVWCDTHNTDMPFLLGPVVPPLDDADLAALRAKLEGN